MEDENTKVTFSPLQISFILVVLILTPLTIALVALLIVRIKDLSNRRANEFEDSEETSSMLSREFRRNDTNENVARYTEDNNGESEDSEFGARAYEREFCQGNIPGSTTQNRGVSGRRRPGRPRSCSGRIRGGNGARGRGQRGASHCGPPSGGPKPKKSVEKSDSLPSYDSAMKMDKK